MDLAQADEPAELPQQRLLLVAAPRPGVDERDDRDLFFSLIWNVKLSFRMATNLKFACEMANSRAAANFFMNQTLGNLK